MEGVDPPIKRIIGNQRDQDENGQDIKELNVGSGFLAHVSHPSLCMQTTKPGNFPLTNDDATAQVLLLLSGNHCSRNGKEQQYNLLTKKGQKYPFHFKNCFLFVSLWFIMSRIIQYSTGVSGQKPLSRRNVGHEHLL